MMATRRGVAPDAAARIDVLLRWQGEKIRVAPATKVQLREIWRENEKRTETRAAPSISTRFRREESVDDGICPTFVGRDDHQAAVIPCLLASSSSVPLIFKLSSRLSIIAW